MIERTRLPYVGIGGVNGVLQQRTLELLYDTLHLEERRRLSLGVRANRATQLLDEPDQRGRAWYPSGDDFRSALQPSGESVAVAQLTVDEDSETMRLLVDRVIERGRRWMNVILLEGIASNTDPRVWRQLIEHIHGYKLDVSVGFGSDMLEERPEQIAAILGELGPIEQVVFDGSSGIDGIGWLERLTPYLERAFTDHTLSRQHTDIAIGNIPSSQLTAASLSSLVRAFPDVSWTAEDALHPPAHPETGAVKEYGRLNTGTAWWYLRESADALRR